jgi:hypothetical protein
MHACSNTDLRKFDLCIFFSVFLVFQCGAFGRSLLASGRVAYCHSDVPVSGVRTELEPCRPDDTCLTSAQALASSFGQILYIVPKRTTYPLLPKAVSVRTSSLHRPDGDPIAAIKCPDRRFPSLHTPLNLLFGIL